MSERESYERRLWDKARPKVPSSSGVSTKPLVGAMLAWRTALARKSTEGRSGTALDRSTQIYQPDAPPTLFACRRSPWGGRAWLQRGEGERLAWKESRRQRRSYGKIGAGCRPPGSAHPALQLVASFYRFSNTTGKPSLGMISGTCWTGIS